jgi:hypothetical protein
MPAESLRKIGNVCSVGTSRHSILKSLPLNSAKRHSQDYFVTASVRILSNEKIKLVRDSTFTARIAASSYSFASSRAAKSSRLRCKVQLRWASTL